MDFGSDWDKITEGKGGYKDRKARGGNQLMTDAKETNSCRQTYEF
jgi:hypothetical protein